MYDYVIVGSGLAGCVAANLLAKKGKKVLILEKRCHLGGNVYDEVDKETNLIVQKYGPHIFHTNDEEVYEYITSICKWNQFHLKCGVDINGIVSPSPFNFKTIDLFFPKNSSEIKEEFNKFYPNTDTITIVDLLNSKSNIIRKYAQFLYNEDYSLYTAKQWGIEPSQVDINVLKRVPVRKDYKECYFTDKYQLMPEGGFYNFITKLLDDKNINVKLNIDALEFIEFSGNKIRINLDNCDEAMVIWTGPIDSLCKYKYGLLPYRSLEFKSKLVDGNHYLKYPVVAYPKASGFTRITDYSLLPEQSSDKTILSYEFPKQYFLGSNTDPYYPINNEDNQRLYGKYLSDIKQFKNIILIGRLAEYKYYNMDQIIKHTLEIFNKD